MPGLGPGGLTRRSACFGALRSFFLENGYIEVDTPLRLPLLLPEAHLVPYASEGFWLHCSPEACMKRLLARGCPRLFQLCHCFRKEENGRLHQGEFAMLEWYRAHADYHDLMSECERLFSCLAAELAGFPGLQKPGCITWQGREIDLSAPWERLTIHDAFQRYAGSTPEAAIREDRFEEVLVERIEPHLGQGRPTFLCDYPVALGSLARKSPENREIAERFELYVAGIELANGFSELNDAAEQRERFAAAITTIEAAGRKAAMPERFLEDLERMPEAAGIALGFDRLFMLLTDLNDIRDAVPFSAEDL